ncbi:MAG: endopeptidase La, partial [Pseudomonadota bacterium]
LNVPVDLSQVLFIGTANSLSTIQGPLRDRMEIVELESYTLDEKVSIAQKHLLPQVIEEHGLGDHLRVSVSDLLMRDVVRGYTREAGVRQLKRELSSLARGLATEIVQSDAFAHAGDTASAVVRQARTRLKSKAISRKDVDKILGPQRFLEQSRSAKLPVGVSTGLAYTPVGGDVLLIEGARVASGSGKLTITGQLGEVMKESVQTALGLLKSMDSLFGVDVKSIQSSDLHVHFPAGAVKKDGPSAGIAILSALVGLYSGRAIASDLAMTGEISLRGDVLPVGGIKEKVLAAQRYGVKRVLIPQDNLRDLEEIPESVRKSLHVQGVRRVEEVIEAVFGTQNSTSARNKTGAAKKTR